eukprot:scaffold10334_cov54-Cyclotella_meneghiniana.AAC.5
MQPSESAMKNVAPHNSRTGISQTHPSKHNAKIHLASHLLNPSRGSFHQHAFSYLLSPHPEFPICANARHRRRAAASGVHIRLRTEPRRVGTRSDDDETIRIDRTIRSRHEHDVASTRIFHFDAVH